MQSENFERWLQYTEGLSSPQNYIEWSFLYLISASLQRRVWMPPAHKKLFPNIYSILVGPPGVGKGLVIRAVSEILKIHKMEAAQFNKAKTPEEQAMLDALAESQRTEAKENKQGELIPMAADAVTYEALVQSMSRAISRIDYRDLDKETGRERLRVHTHSSLCFCIEELSSLFRKNTDSLVTFLIQAYDCAEEYRYETKTQGKDRIINLCLNFLGGTNPDFIRTIFDEGLVSSGFSSRIFFIHATKNRKSVCFMPELTEAQEAHKKHLTNHVLALTKLYGQVIIKPDVFEWMNDWWIKFESTPSMFASKSPKLMPYKSRRNIHLMKIAMAGHFGESTDMEIPLERFLWADKFLDKEEKTMHLALMLEGDTPQSKFSAKIVSYLTSNGQKTYIDLLTEFWQAGLRKDDLTEILQALQDIGTIRAEITKDALGESKMWYQLKKT